MITYTNLLLNQHIWWLLHLHGKWTYHHTFFPATSTLLQLLKSASSAAQIQPRLSGAYSATLTALPCQLWVKVGEAIWKQNDFRDFKLYCTPNCLCMSKIWWQIFSLPPKNQTFHQLSFGSSIVFLLVKFVSQKHDDKSSDLQQKSDNFPTWELSASDINEVIENGG